MAAICSITVVVQGLAFVLNCCPLQPSRKAHESFVVLVV